MSPAIEAYILYESAGVMVPLTEAANVTWVV
jgi:hypothetical protein